MTPREKVADLLTEALKKEGCWYFTSQTIYDNIWTPSGGERQLDIARWDVSITVERDGHKVPIHVHSWITLTELSKRKEIKLIAHSVREYEATA